MTAETSVLTRALGLLAAFDTGHPVLKLADLADRAELPQTTAYRYATDLVQWGALDRAPGGGYQIGLRMLEVAAHCPRGRPLRDVALPYMEDLYEATHQNVQLAVRDGDEVMYVEFLAARNAVAVKTRIGARWPLHATGVGLAILAHSPAEVLDEVLARPFAVFTPKTIDDPDRLRRALAEVRHTGVAISDGQVTLDGYSVAAPVFGPDGRVLAAVSIVVPAGDAKRSAWAPAVRTAANGISRELGAPTTPARRRPVHTAPGR
ncbi:IclR family transcriptional regulator [Nocardia sp. alder85J]|uniref:IclR family transcriptional regulator n=1 Tax=Nocardia sp. alder85J TaxID=2862949 RepID=UPI001CD62EBA|nr:IclR family transcriptional regulator [Nocardia sp. alder85J]MCX4092596.1 IclR family transcriptional regulator [Nocardia sp. alder85J]